jgi:serine/threonine-protein kinase
MPEGNPELATSRAGRVGSTLGKYRLLAELGSGGMATVYLAVARGPSSFTKLLVLKVLRDELAGQAETLTMFLDEARLAARLNHPNVVQTNEVGQEGDAHLLVMEYLDGESLHQLLDRAREKTPVPLAMHLRILSEALNGLHYAHELTDFDGTPLHLVHRDVSPHNVFVTFDGQVKVLDFGIAKAAGSSTQTTKTGVIKGKIRYMGPEQIVGDPVDRRADIFAMGTMLWEAAAGQSLWKGSKDLEIMHRVVYEGVPSPREVKPDMLPSLEAVVMKAMARKIEERYATCLDLQADLEKVLVELGEQVTLKDIAKFTSTLFADVRADRRRLIEAQLKRADSPGSTGEYPIVLRGAVDVGAGSSQTLTGSGVETLGDDPSASARRGWKLMAVLTGTVALLSAGAYAMLRGQPPPVTSAASPVTSPEPAPSSEAASATARAPSPSALPQTTEITIALSATPRDAKLYFDDELLSGNPSTKKLAKDATEHRVRAEARGYAPKTVIITLDESREIAIALDRAQVGVGAATHPSQTALAATTTAAASLEPKPPPAPSTTNKRPLDRGNPWEK